MLQDVPNMAVMVGYTNASWTLGADATATLIWRLLQLMESQSITTAIPCVEEKSITAVPAMNITSTYVVRGAGELPKTGHKAPWKPKQSYVSDLWDAKYGSLTRGLQLLRVSV